MPLFCSCVSLLTSVIRHPMLYFTFVVVTSCAVDCFISFSVQNIFSLRLSHCSRYFWTVGCVALLVVLLLVVDCFVSRLILHYWLQVFTSVLCYWPVSSYVLCFHLLLCFDHLIYISWCWFSLWKYFSIVWTGIPVILLIYFHCLFEHVHVSIALIGSGFQSLCVYWIFFLGTVPC